MAGTPGPLRLRDWLVAQIESGQHEGLRWEDAGKTLFCIPWKHTAKQGYQVQQDAALFRAWAVYKGKYSEGTDKDDPSTWKTRLRCALNKSMEFCEAREHSQLDISNPYKVYWIVSPGGQSPGTTLPLNSCRQLQVPPEEEGIPQEFLRELSEPACEINQLTFCCPDLPLTMPVALACLPTFIQALSPMLRSAPD